MKNLIAAVLLAVAGGSAPSLASSDSPGYSLHVMSLREFSLEGWRIDDYRDSYMLYDDPHNPEREEYWRGGVGAKWTLDLLARGDWGLYWANNVWTRGTDRQIRAVGWWWELGLQLGPRVQVWQRHHSQHVAEAEREGKFPLLNEVGASLVLYRRDP